MAMNLARRRWIRVDISVLIVRKSSRLPICYPSFKSGSMEGGAPDGGDSIVPPAKRYRIGVVPRLELLLELYQESQVDVSII